MNKIWIGNGQLVLPDKIVPGGSVLLEGKKIAAVNVPCPPDARRVDVDGSYIMAGFVDIHVHGGGDSDFMDEDASAFPTIAKAHCAHGTTALCPTTMTCADSLLEKTIDLFLEADKEPENGAELLGLHLEGPYFSAASKGAQPIGEQRIPEREDLERILRRAKGSILRWDAAPELPNMELFAKVMAENGVLTSLAHSAATAPEALRAFDWGFSHVTHFYNACTTFHKKNGLVYSGIVEATYLRDDVTIELIGDGRHIPRESMLLALRIKGADSIALITDAMRAAGVNCEKSVLGAENHRRTRGHPGRRGAAARPQLLRGQHCHHGPVPAHGACAVRNSSAGGQQNALPDTGETLRRFRPQGFAGKGEGRGRGRAVRGFPGAAGIRPGRSVRI